MQISPSGGARRRPPLDQRSFSVRLVIGLAALVLLTTLSAGAPALLIARSQLQRQAAEHLAAAQLATGSLYANSREEVIAQALLLAERPTLQRLAVAGSDAEMAAYLEAFRVQSGLDFLVFCGAHGRIGVGDNPPADCTALPPWSYGLTPSGAATLTVSTDVEDADGNDPVGKVLAGHLLDEAAMQQLAAHTGSAQNVLAPDGRRLASSEPDLFPIGSTRPLTANEPLAWSSQERRFLTAVVPLDGNDGQPALLAEVALSVDGLVTAERRASVILVASTALVALLAMAGGVWAIRRLTAPLQRLTQTAELISAGDFSTPVAELDGPTEVSTLATALQRSQAAMLGALSERSEARDWLNSLIQSIVEGVITFDTRGRVTFISHGAERIIGCASGEALGQPINSLMRPVDPDAAFLDLIPPAGAKRQIEIVAPHGKVVVLAITGARLAPPNSPVPQVALVLRDVTEEETLRSLRSHFLANISHEFRTPLSTLAASMELLLDEEQNLTAAEMRSLLQPTHLSLISLQTLIDNLLESSGIEAGRFTIRKRPVNLNHVITEALQIVHPLLIRRQQSLSLTNPAGLPPIEADPTRLVQVLVNLLSNASKYSPLGRPIDLAIEVAGSALRVSVADRGPGIPESERTALFQRFVRLDAQAGDQYGIGLGLYVVKTIVLAHGGRLGVDDRPGGGSVFWFELPTTGEEQP